MDLATLINIILCILSFLLAAISIVTVIITLRQNHIMIENATRPYICVYGQSVNCGVPTFYLVIKNFGASPATITKFNYEPDLAHCYGVGGNRDYLQMLSSCTFASGQSRMCRLDYSLVPEEITFDIEYLSGNKTYSDHFNVNIKAGASMLTTKVCTSGKELQTISYTLQELLQKLL